MILLVGLREDTAVASMVSLSNRLHMGVLHGKWILFGTYPSLMTLTDLVFTESGHGWVVGQNGSLVLKTSFPLNIDEASSGLQLDVYPNPVRSYLFIKSHEVIDNITVSDEMGKVLFNEHNINTRMHSIDFSTYRPGLYFIKIDNSVRKVLKL